MSYRGPPPPPPPPPPPSSKLYKVLCVSSLHPKASDDVIRDTLYREYRKYGDISVRVVVEPDERVAFVYFRSFEDAREARHSRSRLIVFDRVATVEPVYESRSQRSSRDYHGDHSRGSQRDRDKDRERGRMRERERERDRDRERSPIQRDYYRDGYRPPYQQQQQHLPQRRTYPRGGGGGGHGHESHRGRGASGGGGYDLRMELGHKKEKFPNYLSHLLPEDDSLATRTLFVGNLEVDITDEEINKIFGKFGHLVDIDIKKPSPGTGNAYAFIRYENLDMAHRAKVELSGQYIGKFQCKIGYGKANPTCKVWVGGLGPWCTEVLLWKEFDRFGVIKKIEYAKGDPFAHVFYEIVDAAQSAVQEMRGFPLGGPEKRLRIDFADLDPVAEGPGADAQSEGRPRVPGKNPRSTFIEGGKGKSSRSGAPSTEERTSELARASTIEDIVRKTPKVWEGGLILKNSLFPTKLHVVEGNRHITDIIVSPETGAETNSLKITQRLRLDQTKLEDVKKRMLSASSHAIFLAVAGSTPPLIENSDQMQSKPLKNLKLYLKQKEAAGVISLSEGVLYCFPPCQFSTDLLRREAPNLTDEAKDDFLVVVVICGSQN